MPKFIFALKPVDFSVLISMYVYTKQYNILNKLIIGHTNK